MKGRTNSIIKGTDLPSDPLGYLGQTTGWGLYPSGTGTSLSFNAEWWNIPSGGSVSYIGLFNNYPQNIGQNDIIGPASLYIYDDLKTTYANTPYKVSICKFDTSVYKRMRVYVYNPLSNGNSISNQTYIVSEAIAENDRTNGITSMHDEVWYEASAHSNTAYTYDVDLTQFPVGVYEFLSVRRETSNGYTKKSVSPRFFYA